LVRSSVDESKDPDAMLTAVRDYWGPVFTEKAIDEDAAAEYIDKWFAPASKRADFTFSEEDLLRAARHGRDASPGPDRLPYAAWARSPGAISWLYRLSQEAQAGLGFPDSFNHGLLVLIPKNGEAFCAAEAIRRPGKLRPLTLLNTDRKLIGTVVNHELAAVAQKEASDTQHGFVRGRSFIPNIINMDLIARTFSALSETEGGHPALLTFDVRAAFPSVCRKWMMLVLDRCGLCEGALTLISAMYDKQLAWLRVGDEMMEAFTVTAGVGQGCPMSGSLWALLFSPFLEHLSFVLDLPWRWESWKPVLPIVKRKGDVEGCADDVGVVIRDLSMLALIGPVFSAMQVHACLELNMQKCHLVPLWAPLTDEVTFFARSMLEAAATGWSNFTIASAAKYLGCWLGPGADLSKQWHAPFAKYAARTRALGASALSNDAVVQAYNGLAVPCLLYVSMLFPFPVQLLDKELDLLHVLLRVPPKSFRKDCLLALGGSLQITAPLSLFAASTAARMRVAIKMQGDWMEPLASVEDHFLDVRGEAQIHVVDLSEKLFTPRWWCDRRGPARHLQDTLQCRAPHARPRARRQEEARMKAAARRTAAAETAWLHRPRGRRGERPKKRFSYQSSFRSILTSLSFPDSFPITIRQRLSSWGVRPPALQVLIRRWGALKSVLLGRGRGVRWAVIKVLCGAWPTAARMHVSSIRSAPCKFGCQDGLDCMSHYLRCRHLWWAVCLPRDFCSGSVLMKLCLGPPRAHSASPDDDLDRSVSRLSLAHQLHCIIAAHPGFGPQHLLRCLESAPAPTGR